MRLFMICETFSVRACLEGRLGDFYDLCVEGRL